MTDLAQHLIILMAHNLCIVKIQPGEKSKVLSFTVTHQHDRIDPIEIPFGRADDMDEIILEAYTNFCHSMGRANQKIKLILGH